MGTYVLQDEKKHPDRRRRGERQNSFVPSSSPDSADFGTKAISSARDQAGFFAKGGGFDIYVEKNTDLKGGLIASKASPDKNKLSTGTLSYNDLKNEADYSAKSIGATYHKYGNYKNMTEDEQNKVYNTIGLAPNISIPVKGDGSSTTKSVIAAGTIDIRENKAQDISALSRDTANSLNELGKIFEETWLESQATG